MKEKYKYIIGIDEVGRGPLAGPVTVGAVALRYGFKLSKKKLDDSKKLSAEQREEWFAYIKEHPDISFATASVSSKLIDRIGINKAISQAIARAIDALSIWKPGFKMDGAQILLDGLLYAPKKYRNQKTIVKGDEKIQVIALASIIAKVSRDRKMVRMAKKYPEYGFETHKGYGTREHYKNIKKHGVSAEHRKTFLD